MGFKVASDSALGPTSYATATKPTITVEGVSAINSLDDVLGVWLTGGFTAVATAVSGNAVTIEIRRTGAINVAEEEVPDTTNISAETIHVSVRGY